MGEYLERMQARFPNMILETALWHGDFTPWNMARLGPDLLVWDWEHSAKSVPLGFDHLHFMAQSMRMKSGTGADVEQRWLDKARDALWQTWDVPAAAVEATILYYLLEVNLRYIGDRENDPLGIPPRQGWGRELVRQLIEGGT